MIKVPYSKQKNDYTCGPACLKMVFGYYGKKISEKELARLAGTKEHVGTDNNKMIDIAKSNGFHCYAKSNATICKIKRFLNMGFPVIINFKESSEEGGHYAVVVGSSEGRFVLNDPWNGKNVKIEEEELERRWYDDYRGRKYNKWLLVISPKKLEVGKRRSPRTG